MMKWMLSWRKMVIRFDGNKRLDLGDGILYA